MQYDKIIIGAGLYGLYAALKCGLKGERVLVFEYDEHPFSRATYINQARVHMGYHYPRSFSTAIKSAGYFERFVKDYGFCINSEFDQIYATSTYFSWTAGVEFQKFCKAAKIKCEPVLPEKYFQKNMCDGAFLTREYTYDAQILCQFFLEKLKALSNVKICCGARIHEIHREEKVYRIVMENFQEYETNFLLNASYASTNQILDKLNSPKFKIKYELCEIILGKASKELKNTGITVMDGPFFSVMPFGKTGLHSLTSVTFTPHLTSFQELPEFPCQKEAGGYCSPKHLGNCNLCAQKPETAFRYMQSLSRKYMRQELDFEYHSSLFSMKPILKTSEIDDSRPTVIRVLSQNPTFVSVLSGKINTVYDLDEVLGE